MNKKEMYISLCKQGLSSKEIKERMNLKCIGYYTKITGVKFRHARTRNTTLNEKYFNNITTEEQAYILGFIYADGYITSDNRTLSFQLNKKDIEILDKIKSCLNSNVKYTKSSNINGVRVNFCSKYMVKSLNRLGVVRNKTKKLYLPSLPSNLYRHFFRGLFDGDGYIGKYQCTLIISSDKFYTDLVEFINTEFNTTLSSKKYDNYYRVNFTRKNASIIKWMYQDSNIYLTRKYNSYYTNWHNYNG